MHKMLFVGFVVGHTLTSKLPPRTKKKKNAYDDVLAGSSDNPRYFSSGPTQSPS